MKLGENPHGLLGLVAVLAASGLAAAAPLAGGGFTATYQTLSVPKLNDVLKSAGLPEVDKAMWLLGGGGYGPLVGAEGLTIGGFGAGGRFKATQNNRTVWFDLAYGGPRVGYRQSISGPLTLDAGLGVAFGGASLTVLDKEPTAFSEGLKTTGYYETTYRRFILGLVPDVSVSLAVAPFLHVEAGAAYFWDTRAGEGWTGARGSEALTGQPEDPLSGAQFRLAFVFGPQ